MDLVRSLVRTLADDAAWKAPNRFIRAGPGAPPGYTAEGTVVYAFRVDRAMPCASLGQTVLYARVTAASDHELVIIQTKDGRLRTARGTPRGRPPHGVVIAVLSELPEKS